MFTYHARKNRNSLNQWFLGEDFDTTQLDSLNWDVDELHSFSSQLKKGLSVLTRETATEEGEFVQSVAIQTLNRCIEDSELTLQAKVI